MANFKTQEWRVSRYRNAPAARPGEWPAHMGSGRAGCPSWWPGPGPRAARRHSSPLAATEDLTQGDQRRDRGPDHRPAQGPGRAGLDAGPNTITWHLRHHHHVTVSAATISRLCELRGAVDASVIAIAERLNLKDIATL
jgi:hypothetical protein